MNIRGDSGALDSLLLQFFANRSSQSSASSALPSNSPASPRKSQPRDIVTLSGQNPDGNQLQQQSGFQTRQTRLISEEIENLGNGFRRMQEFETVEGRTFSRVEEFTADQNRAKKTIIQQNSSGSTTVLENVLDRQADGTFRSTERFTDEVGTVSTNIQFDITPNNIDILLGRPPSPERQNITPFGLSRGTQIDLSA